MDKIAFVVLHYESLDDTKKCLDSLMKYREDPRVEIIAVDNGSSKGKLETLAPQYGEKSKIHFIYSEENLGFARGNNLGFKYAKYELGAKVIVLCNNDLIFRQEDFVDRLFQCREKTGFDVAGPKILSLVDHKNQNPVSVQYRSLKDVNMRIFKDSILAFLCRFNLDSYARRIFAKEVPEITYEPGMEFQLHGACMFFANRFVENYDGLCDRTFMYGEENILKYMTVKDGMRMVYLDDVIVHHKEGSATCKLYGKGQAKRQFYYKWKLHGAKQLKQMMQEA